jgi:two-component system chemotaxis response regulator CheY
MLPAREEHSNDVRLSALIVDDSPIIRAILKRVLPSYSIDCDEAKDGREALERFERSLQARRPYDLVCLDVGLPEIDGHTVLCRMRSAEEQFPETAPVYIVVLTADDSHETVARMLSDGANTYILKPFDRESFHVHVERIVRQKSSRAAAQSQ